MIKLNGCCNSCHHSTSDCVMRADHNVDFFQDNHFNNCQIADFKVVTKF